MKTIELDGKTYEVLTIDRISEITHARLAGGKVVTASEIGCGIVRLASPTFYVPTKFGEDELEPYGIQPLRLVPEEPVTFETTFYRSNSTAWVHGNGGAQYKTIKVRCVEIVEEA